MADRAQPEFVDALVLIVNTLRPTWRPVARGYIERDARLLDAATLARRAVGAATDPSVVLPSYLSVWEPPPPVLDEREVSRAGREQPEPITTWANAPRCGHGEINGRCALCRVGAPEVTEPTRGAFSRPVPRPR